MNLDPAVVERLRNNLRHEIPYGSCQVLCNDVRAMLDALEAAEDRIRAARIWSHMHQSVDHACAECRALRQVMEAWETVMGMQDWEIAYEDRKDKERLQKAHEITTTALEKITHSQCYDPGEGGCIGENKCPRCTAKEALFHARERLKR